MSARLIKGISRAEKYYSLVLYIGLFFMLIFLLDRYICYELVVQKAVHNAQAMHTKIINIYFYLKHFKPCINASYALILFAYTWSRRRTMTISALEFVRSLVKAINYLSLSTRFAYFFYECIHCTLIDVLALLLSMVAENIDVFRQVQLKASHPRKIKNVKQLGQLDHLFLLDSR